MSRMGEYHAAVEARDDEILRLEALVDQGQIRIRYLEGQLIEAKAIMLNMVNQFNELVAEVQEMMNLTRDPTP